MTTFKHNAKAVAAFLSVGVVMLLNFITGDESWSDVTTAEWLTVLAEMLGAAAVVWAVPNSSPAGE